MLSSESITVAIHQPSGKIIHINNALNGLACECVCQECGQRFEAIQGRKRKNHFRHHKIDTNCKGGLETALHKLAKQILIDNMQINLPKYGRIAYQNAVSEKSFEQITPDVSAELLDGRQVFFEVYHRHKVEFSKEFFFRTGAHKSVEINMKTCPTDSYNEIKNFILYEIDNKRIIYWEVPKQLIVPKQNQDLDKLRLLACFVGFGLIIRILFPKFFRSVWKSMF